MKTFLRGLASVLVAYVLFLATLNIPTIRAQIAGAINNGQPTYLLGVDPCASNGVAKSNVSVTITTATTTQIVALSGTTTIYVCAFTFTINSSATSASSMIMEYGTGASCGTGTTALTGAMGTEQAAAGAGILIVNGPYSGYQFKTPAGNALCILTAGTTVALHGQVTYVQI